MAQPDNAFAIMGDLGGGVYIVRMFVGNASIDEEFTASNTDDLIQQIENRQSGLAKLSGAEIEKRNTGGQPLLGDDHAIPLTPEQGA